jgi:hypothetical protein
MQRANTEAYSMAIARTIVIDNVSEEAHFVLEHQAMLVPNILHAYHLPKKASMRIVVHIDNFQSIHKDVKHHLQDWIEMLDPSDIRTIGEPKVTTISTSDYSDDNLTQISLGVESMLSVDMTEYTIFEQQSTTTRTTERPILDVTMSASDKVIQKQQILIKQHEKKIEDLMSTIQSMKEETNKKMDQLVEMLTALTEANTHKVKDKQVTTGGSKGIPIRRLP